MDNLPKYLPQQSFSGNHSYGNKGREISPNTRKAAENAALELFLRLTVPLGEFSSEVCWLWPYKRTTQGYGVLRIRLAGSRIQHVFYAHRLSYRMKYGNNPKVAMHACDEPSCWNPLHISDGTQSKNMRDMAAKGRQWKQGAGVRKGSEAPVGKGE